MVFIDEDNVFDSGFGIRKWSCQCSMPYYPAEQKEDGEATHVRRRSGCDNGSAADVKVKGPARSGQHRLASECEGTYFDGRLLRAEYKSA